VKSRYATIPPWQSRTLWPQGSTHLKRQFWGRHFWARGYFTVISGTITDEMINEYINKQEGEPVEDDGRFQIDPS
jgi:putative transposase